MSVTPTEDSASHDNHHARQHRATWRDLIDQLTPEQIAHIEHWQAHPELPPRADGKPRTVEAQRNALLFSATESA